MTENNETAHEGDQAKRARLEEQTQRRGRTWSERLEQPLKFRHYSGIDGGGRPRIFIKFDLEPGQSKLHPDVAAIISDLKVLGGRRTDLKFERDNVHGKVYRLPDTVQGRATAEVLVAKLLDLGRRLAREQGNSR